MKEEEFKYDLTRFVYDDFNVKFGEIINKVDNLRSDLKSVYGTEVLESLLFSTKIQLEVASNYCFLLYEREKKGQEISELKQKIREMEREEE